MAHALPALVSAHVLSRVAILILGPAAGRHRAIAHAPRRDPPPPPFPPVRAQLWYTMPTDVVADRRAAFLFLPGHAAVLAGFVLSALPRVLAG